MPFKTVCDFCRIDTSVWAGGKLFDALTIAVATGFHPQAQISAARPEFLFDSLKDWWKILRTIDQF